MPVFPQPPIQNFQPQANPQISFGIISEDIVAKAGVFLATVSGATTRIDLNLHWRLTQRFEPLPRLESLELSEEVLTQLGIYHATSLIHILDEAAYYPKVKNHIMSIIAPYVEANQAVDFDVLPITATGVIGNSADDERTGLTDDEVRNMSFFRFLGELEGRTYKPDDREDEE